MLYFYWNYKKCFYLSGWAHNDYPKYGLMIFYIQNLIYQISFFYLIVYTCFFNICVFTKVSDKSFS